MRVTKLNIKWNTVEVKVLDISSEKVLNKMELLIKQAKIAKSAEEMSRYISSVQILCELLVETEPAYEASELSRLIPREKDIVKQVPAESVTGNIVKMDDANGTSLLDF